MHWLADPAEAQRCACQVQTRYRQAPVAAAVRLLSPDGAAVEVAFAAPVFAVTPGQALVLYAGDRVLGGGWIE
jgi:tRNA-specific 2-thiouridylase